MRPLFMLFLFAFISFQTTAQSNYNLKLIDRYAYGRSSKIICSGDIAFLNSGANLLRLDISDPTDVVELSAIEIGPIIEDFWIQNNLVYSLSHDSLYIGEILENGSIVLQNQIRLKFGEIIRIWNGHLYVADYEGFKIFNITEPFSPSLIGQVLLDIDPSTMVYYDDFVFTTHLDNEYFGIIDVRNKSFPTFSKFELPGNKYIASSYLVNDTLYIGSSDSLHVFKVQAEGNLKRLGATYILFANRLDVKNGYAYLAAQGHGFHIYDVHNPQNMFNVGSADPFLDHVVVHQHVAYGFLWQAGLVLIDVTNPYDPQEINHIQIGEECYGMELEGSHLYLSSGIYGVRTINLNDGNGFTTEVTPYIRGRYVKNLVTAYPYLFAADANGQLLTFEVLSDGSIEERQSIETDNIAYLTIYNNLLFLSGSYPGGSITAINVIDPVNPVVLDQIKTEQPINAIAVSGNYLYAHEKGRNVKIIDFSDPDNLLILDSFPYSFDKSFNMIVEDDQLFIASGELQVFDITDPLMPQKIDIDINEYNIRRIRIESDLLYIASKYRGLTVWEIADIENPNRIAQFDNINSPVDLDIINDTIYLMDALAGVYIFKLDQKTTAANKTPDSHGSINIFPNPSREYIEVKFLNKNKEIIQKIELINLLGQSYILYQNLSRVKENPKLVFKLSNYITGTYMLTIQTEKHNYIRKIMIVR